MLAEISNIDPNLMSTTEWYSERVGVCFPRRIYASRTAMITNRIIVLTYKTVSICMKIESLLYESEIYQHAQVYEAEQYQSQHLTMSLQEIRDTFTDLFYL